MIWRARHALAVAPQPGRTENDSLPRRDNLHATAKAVGLAIKSRRFGDREADDWI